MLYWQKNKHVVNNFANFEIMKYWVWLFQDWDFESSGIVLFYLKGYKEKDLH